MNQSHVYRTAALVLRRQDFGEADRLLTLYSPWRGKFRAIAKGVRRPKSRLGGHVELFTHVNLLVAQGRNLDIVTQAETIRPFGHIRDDLWKTSYACYVTELVDRFTEEHLENQPIFDLLLQALTYLDEVAADPSADQIREPGEPGSAVETAMRNFELQLLGHLGYAPELMRCVQCQERLVDGENRFSPSSGGVVCANCSAVHPGGRLLSVNAIKAMRLMSQEPFGVFRRLRLTPDQSFEVEGALRSHINFILERQLRTAEFLDRMKADRKRERRQAAVAAV
jgi:DNA repair protein RecO (recombination protein O)